MVSLPHSQSMAWGAIVGTTGAITVIEPPPSVAKNDLQSDLYVVAFYEVQMKTLARSLDVDIVNSGTYSETSSPGLSPGTVSAGTTINSYYLSADSLSGGGGLSAIFDGTITFSDQILGVDVLSETLDAGIDRLGADNVLYPYTRANSGLEITPSAGGSGLDTITLTPDRHTIVIHFLGATNTDQVRIITAVPEPTSIALLGVGAAVLISCRRRFRRRTISAAAT